MTGGGLICGGLGCVSSAGRCPSLPSLPPPELQPPGWQADRLLPELLHDLSDPGQVGLAESEVALSGPHVIANHAVLGGRGETFRLGCDNVLSGVQEAPVIPVTGCEKKQRHSEPLFSNAETTSPVIPRPAPGQRETRRQAVWTSSPCSCKSVMHLGSQDVFLFGSPLNGFHRQGLGV